MHGKTGVCGSPPAVDLHPRLNCRSPLISFLALRRRRAASEVSTRVDTCHCGKVRRRTLMIDPKNRRQFLKTAAATGVAWSAADWAFLGTLPRVSAADVTSISDRVQFTPEIEPL